MSIWYSHQPDAGAHWITGNPAVLPSGTLYAVVGPSIGWVNPSSAEIIAGTLAGGGLASWLDDKPTVSLTSDPFIWPNDTTGLTAGTWYRAAVVWNNGITTSVVVVSTPWQADVVYTGATTTQNAFRTEPWHTMPTGAFKTSAILGLNADVWVAQGRGFRKAENCMQPLATVTSVQERMMARTGRRGAYVLRNNAIDSFSPGATLTPRTDAVSESWLIVMGDSAPTYGTNTALVGITTSHSINCYTDRIALQGFSTELLVLTEAFEPGKTIYGHLQLNSQRIKTVNGDASSTDTLGNVLFTDLLSNELQSISMIIRWTNVKPDEALIDRLLRNPLEALAPKRVYVNTVEAEEAGRPTVGLRGTRARTGYRLTQPKGTPRVARNALTVGMTGCLWVGGGPGGVRDLISRNPTWPVKNGAQRVTPQGTAHDCAADYNNVESQRSSFDSSNSAGEPAGWRPAAPPMTLMAYFAHTTSGGVSAPLAGSYNTGYTILDYNGSHQLQSDARIGGVSYTVYQGTATSSTTPMVRGLTCSTSLLTGWDNGKSYGTTAVGAGNFEYDVVNNRIGLLASSDYSGTGYRGYGYWMAIWDRVLTPREIKFLAANPWAIFAEDAQLGYGLQREGSIKPLRHTALKLTNIGDSIEPHLVLIDHALNRGVALLDFGGGAVSTTTVVTLTDLPINPYKVQLWVSADDFTESHTAAEHKYLALQVRTSVGYHANGFVINAYANQPLAGRYKLRYKIG